MYLFATVLKMEAASLIPENGGGARVRILNIG